jgi:hypothetical protein
MLLQAPSHSSPRAVVLHTLVNVSFSPFFSRRNSSRLGAQGDVDASEGAVLPQILNVALPQAKRAMPAKPDWEDSGLDKFSTVDPS